MRTIKLKRPREDFNTEVKYDILVNGTKITALRNGEEKLLKLHQGAQIMEGKVRSGSSEKFLLDDLETGQTIEITGDRLRNKYGKFAGAILPAIGLTFILDHQYNTLKIVGLIVFSSYLIVMLYVLLFQKNKWIHLQPIS